MVLLRKKVHQGVALGRHEPRKRVWSSNKTNLEIKSKSNYDPDLHMDNGDFRSYFTFPNLKTLYLSESVCR